MGQLEHVTFYAVAVVLRHCLSAEPLEKCLHIEEGVAIDEGVYLLCTQQAELLDTLLELLSVFSAFFVDGLHLLVEIGQDCVHFFLLEIALVLSEAVQCVEFLAGILPLQKGID